MQLIVAEKPSVGRDLARVLGVTGAGGNKGFIEGAGAGPVITWCIGHLVELEEPAGYDLKWKAWRLDALPMLPERFRLRVTRDARAQFEVVRRLMRDGRFGEVVNACDAGREGELIFRYVYELAGCRLPVRRLWVSSLTDEAVKAGFRALRDGRAFDALGDAARCRSEADWLVGMNATRAITVARRGGVYEKGKVWSIGRVQTPTLAILVERERAIREFVPRDYWEVLSRFECSEPNGRGGFSAKWFFGKVTRFAKAEAARTVVSRAQAIAAGVVERVHRKSVKEPPPLLFDLTSLQRTANKRFGMSASRTLEVAQSLYEKHKLLTYPRTDSRYLTTDLIEEMPRLFSALAALPAYAAFAQTLLTQGIKPTRRIFDDARVSDHHAIVPTGKAVRLEKLDAEETRIFDLVAGRFLGVFFPDAEFALTEVIVRVGDDPPDTTRPPELPGEKTADEDRWLEAAPPGADRFLARGKVRLASGWQAVAGFGDDEAPAGRRGGARGRGEAAETEEVAEKEQALPLLVEGERLSGQFEAVRKGTKPPPRLTEAALLGAMESAGKSIDDEALRQAMKDRGLGTPATRAATIETLLRRRFVAREKKHLLPTPMGIELIETLPVTSLASPELTGEWEAKLARIARREETRASFMAEIGKYVTDVVAAIRRIAPRSSSVRDARFERAQLPPPGNGVVYFVESPEPMNQAVAERHPGAKVANTTKVGRGKSEGAPSSRVALEAMRCPRCQVGRLMEGRRGWGCTRWKEGCGLVVWFEVGGRRVTEGQLRDLVTRGKTRKGVWSGRAGRLVLDAARDGGAVVFVED